MSSGPFYKKNFLQYIEGVTSASSWMTNEKPAQFVVNLKENPTPFHILIWAISGNKKPNCSCDWTIITFRNS
jgi:hypothetical protein